MSLHQFSALIVFAIIIATTIAGPASAATCYCKNSDTISSNCYGGLGGVPCSNATNGGFVQCCANGDICGQDGFCHYTHPQNLGSGYYIGGCTDPDYKDSVCPSGCVTEEAPDVVYNSATQLWACCSGAEGATNCSDPLLDTFQAPSPQILFVPTSASQSSSSSSTSSPTSTSSTSPSAAATPSSSSSSSSSLSSGAAAGIGVGVAVGLVAIAAIIALVCFRRRRKARAVRAQPQQEQHVYSQDIYPKDRVSDTHWIAKDQKYEISTGMMFASELPGQAPSELLGSPQSKHVPGSIELAER